MTRLSGPATCSTFAKRVRKLAFIIALSVSRLPRLPTGLPLRLFQSVWHIGPHTGSRHVPPSRWSPYPRHPPVEVRHPLQVTPPRQCAAPQPGFPAFHAAVWLAGLAMG